VGADAGAGIRRSWRDSRSGIRPWWSSGVKMENELRAPHAGTVRALHVQSG
jgi:hypothetical protein